METVDINSLNANPKNPRQISKADYKNLVQSIKKFGDLSGIVYNETTEQLVGGHQRIQAFKELGGQPVIVDRFEVPNSVGTVGMGYVLLGDEKYTYRVVRWDANFEKAANVAANRIQGEFDLDLLTQLNHELQSLENGAELLQLTGQSEDEIRRLLSDAGVVEPQQEVEREENVMKFHLNQAQSELVNEALLTVMSRNEFDLEANPDKYGNALHALSRFYMDRSGE